LAPVKGLVLCNTPEEAGVTSVALRSNHDLSVELRGRRDPIQQLVKSGACWAAYQEERPGGKGSWLLINRGEPRAKPARCASLLPVLEAAPGIVEIFTRRLRSESKAKAIAHLVIVASIDDTADIEVAHPGFNNVATSCCNNPSCQHTLFAALTWTPKLRFTAVD